MLNDEQASRPETRGRPLTRLTRPRTGSDVHVARANTDGMGPAANTDEMSPAFDADEIEPAGKATPIVNPTPI